MNVAGGVRIEEPGADLAVALAIASAARDEPLSASGAPSGCFGEIGLTGELRYVAHADRRLEEAARFGLERIVLPARCADDELSTARGARWRCRSPTLAQGARRGARGRGAARRGAAARPEPPAPGRSCMPAVRIAAFDRPPTAQRAKFSYHSDVHASRGRANRGASFSSRTPTPQSTGDGRAGHGAPGGHRQLRARAHRRADRDRRRGRPRAAALRAASSSTSSTRRRSSTSSRRWTARSRCPRTRPS